MNFSNEIITIERDCEAILIPSGDPIKLIKGTHVRITQALGGDFTLFVNGNLVKISGKDADAIGHTPTILEQNINNNKPSSLGPIKEEDIWDQLKTVYDPEIPVNIVELGLIYDLKINNEDNNIHIKMTLTAPGCGMGPVIAQDAEDKIKTIPGVNNVLVEIVWEPIWNRDMMTDEAKLQLGMM